GDEVLIGNRALVEERGISADALTPLADPLGQTGAGIMLIAVDGQPAGLIAVSDRVKPSSREAIDILHAAGIRIVMTSGDSRQAAQAVADSLGIDEVRAEALPDTKLELVGQLRREGRVVAMAGDGVNDAPALAAADVG